MHVGDPHYAAQLQTADGDVVDFDDPGCLFEYVRARRPRVHAIYFHDSTTNADRWWSRDEVGFVRAERTPMGFGFAAVARSTPGAIAWDEASQRVGPTSLAGGSR
jgi:hypothetical protein